MGKQKTENKINKKKEFRCNINMKLDAALSDFKTEVGEKKFNTALKKTSKILSSLLYVKKKKEKKTEVQELSA